MNRRKLLCFCIVGAGLMVSGPLSIAHGQAPLARMDSVTLTVPDTNESTAFWESLGGHKVNSSAVDIPGAHLLFQRGTPGSGSDGEAINHFGIRLKDGTGFFERAKAMGLKLEPTPLGCKDAPGHGCGFVTTRDGIRVEIYEDTSQATPITFDHVHLFVAAPQTIPQMQDWYAKVFHGTQGLSGSTGKTPAVALPGVSIRFNPSPTPVIPTAGRAITSFGLAVSNVETFCRELDAQLAKCAGVTQRSATITDPQGAIITLTNGSLQ